MKFTHKIALMPLVAGLAFIITLTISWTGASTNREILVRIENENLEALTISNSLEKSAINMRHVFQNASTVRDADQLVEADKLKDEFLENIARCNTLKSIKRGSLKKLEEGLISFHEVGGTVTRAVIDGAFDEGLFAKVEKMNTGYETLIADLEVFSKEQQVEIRSEFANANRTQARNNLVAAFSILLGIASIVFISILVIRGVSQTLKEIGEVANAIAHGDLTQTLEVQHDDQVGRLSTAINVMVIALKKNRDEMQANIEMGQAVVAEVNRVAEKFRLEGDLEVTPNLNLATGSYRQMLEGLDALMKNFVSELMLLLELVSEYAEGKLDREAPELIGKKVVLTHAINGIRANLLALIDESVSLATATEEGRLDARGNASKFKGGYQRIIQGFNNTIENLLEPVNESVKILTEMSRGNLSKDMTGDYRGDHIVMKEAMNSTLQSLNELIGEAMHAADRVRGGAEQVTQSSQALSKGAIEQASSLEEIGASIEEISSQTRQNAESAMSANQLSNSVRTAADDGNQQMNRMLGAMTEINESSNEISKIIKVIDEIAFQTNLLALNAAVEAARAGVHGKGFAVVADEVRTLAQRSAKAANETTELIKGSIQRIDNGSKIADQTAAKLEEIIHGVSKVNTLVGEIAEASKQQSMGIDQVTETIRSIDQLTQMNASSAEESASSADELLSQASHLKSMLVKFELKSDSRRRNEPRRLTSGTSSKKQSKLLQREDDSYASEKAWDSSISFDSFDQDFHG